MHGCDQIADEADPFSLALSITPPPFSLYIDPRHREPEHNAQRRGATRRVCVWEGSEKKFV